MISVVRVTERPLPAPPDDALRVRALDEINGGEMSHDELDARGLTPDAAQRVLALAAALDADPAGALSFSQLSAIAAEAGISSMAMEQVSAVARMTGALAL